MTNEPKDINWREIKYALDKIPHLERFTVDDVLALKRGLNERGLKIVWFSQVSS